MCQLNLYLVPKNVPEDNIINIFEKHDLYISKEIYYKFNEPLENYEFYSANLGCDCSSIISRLEEEDFSSFEDYKIRKKAEDINKLNKVKKLRASQGYKTKVRAFEKQRDKLWEVLDNFSEHIADYEAEERERIFALNIQEEEKSRMLHEILYPKLTEMYRTLESNKEYQNVYKEYRGYIAENADLQESIYYDIEEKEKNIAEYDFSDLHNQFSDLKNTYIEVLKLTNEIGVYPFWQDGEPLEIKGKRQVMIQNLTIEDLIFLPYRNLLQIRGW